MHILLTADPEIPVPPRYYGGIERIIALLVNGLQERGHVVTLLAHPESQVECRLIPWNGRSSVSLSDTARHAWLLARHALSGKFDVVHSFSRIAYLTGLLPWRLPKIMSYQREPTPGRIKTAMRLAGKNSLVFTGCSNYITDKIKTIAPAITVYNGVPLHTFEFQPFVPEDAPLVFLGRLEPIKGPQLAIDIAKATGRCLILAGNIPPEASHFFSTAIKPHIDGKQIRYVGPVDDLQKNRLLGQAAALLMPILWDEPFGIVMAEALACGTPVLAFARGAAPEVVSAGKNGFLGASVPELCAAVQRIPEIDRTVCRAIARQQFSADAVVEGYLDLYHNLKTQQNARLESLDTRIP